MEVLFLQRMNIVPHPRVRLAILLVAMISIFLIRNPLPLVAMWLLIAVPLVLLTHMQKAHVQFLSLIVAPLSAALFVIWALIMGAKPGDLPHSSPKSGAEFALLITIRLILVGAIFQVGILSLGLDGVGSLCSDLGLPPDLRTMIVGATVLVPEMRLRASQVFTARCARGLLKTRGIWSRTQQLPFMLRALVVWALRSALERADMWNHRGFFNREPHHTRESYRQFKDHLLATVPDLAHMSGNVFIDGPNFSGRSDMLLAVTGLKPSADALVGVGAYVGPEIYNAISGLTSTVASELTFNGVKGCNGLGELVQSSALSRIQSCNPFAISGGEQALLAIVAAIASGHNVCGMDCAAEQLDQHNRQMLFRWMSEHSPLNGALRVIVDNRAHPQEFENCIKLAASNTDTPRILSNAFNPPPVEAAALGMNNMWFRYSKAADWVFKDCSIELEPHKIYILRGANGAGKSTWAKLVTGVLRPERGVITSGNKCIKAWDRPGSLVGYHFQHPDLQLFCESVEEELGHNGSPNKSFLEGVTEAFGLHSVLHWHPMDLPFAVRKRVALAATVCMMRPWLIVDEPVLGQDRNSAEGIACILRSLANSGSGVIIVSHCEWFDDLFEATPLYIEEAQLIARRRS